MTTDLKFHQGRIASAILTNEVTKTFRHTRHGDTGDITKKVQAYIDAMQSFGFHAERAMGLATEIYCKAVWVSRMQLAADAYAYADRLRAIPSTRQHAIRAQEIAARYYKDARYARNLYMMNEASMKEVTYGEG
jgi:hypothetical protein